jgi:hypothetical protein
MGGILWGGVWAIAYRVWIELFAFVPIFVLLINVVLAMRGAEWAYRNQINHSVRSAGTVSMIASVDNRSAIEE